MKTPERTVDPDADDDNWHWDELGNHSNASKRKMDGPVDPVDGNRTLESNTSNVSGLECLQTDQFYLEGRAVKKKPFHLLKNILLKILVPSSIPSWLMFDLFLGPIFVFSWFTSTIFQAQPPWRWVKSPLLIGKSS